MHSVKTAHALIDFSKNNVTVDEAKVSKIPSHKLNGQLVDTADVIHHMEDTPTPETIG